VSLPVPVAIAGTGVPLPPEVVTDERPAPDTSDEWIVSRTGIRVRRRPAPDRATPDRGAAAARPALAAAGLTARDVDAIIVGTDTCDQPPPSTAAIVKELLGAGRALTLDVTQAACANGVQALFLAAHLLQTPAASTVLVVAAGCASRLTGRTTRVFFGDAAGAAVLTRASSAGSGLLGWDFGTELSDDAEIPAGGSRLPASATTFADRRHHGKTAGRSVRNTAIRCLPESILRAVDAAGLTVAEVTRFFLPQANPDVITVALDELGVPRERAPVTVDRLGVPGSAGVFTALHSAFGRNAVRPGDTYVVSSIGAGFRWGTLCFRHG
jgi:3-oxoacyl-[acyl-carrier-protein] synthase-3